MNKFTKFIFLVVILTVTSNVTAAQTGPLRFRVTLSKDVASKNLSGRMFVFMSDSPQPQERLGTDFIPGSTWISALEIEAIAPNETIEFNPDIKAYPKPFSQAKLGRYQFMALLDLDHSLAYNGQGEGDIYSAVVRIENLNPANTGPVELTLNKVTEARFKPANSENIKQIEILSPMLTEFWGRPIVMRAGVILPPSYGKNAKRQYPTVYVVHGFGGNHTGAWRRAPELAKAMSEGKISEMVYVFLDGSFPTGHHEFADSVNNGPWGRALTQEFIPSLEKEFKLIAKPYARFLTGHSSGGWSTLWLQVNYPDLFGGTWSTAPDPVDLRSFSGINMTPSSNDNVYRKTDGAPRTFGRYQGREIGTLEEYARQEEVQGSFGGQFSSFEWVWSPKGQDGRPVQAFNRKTGEINQDVLAYWRRYDIRLLLDQNWTKLEPKLRDKIHIIVGSADTFRLEESVVMLCDFFKQKKSDAVCEVVPGRDHSDLYKPYDTYKEGLDVRIAKEMQAQFEKSQASSQK